MTNKSEVLDKMKSTWHYYRDFRRSRNLIENLPDEGVCQGALCIDALYHDYQHLKKELKNAKGVTTCPECGQTIEPIADICPACGVRFVTTWNREWDSQSKVSTIKG